MPGLKRFALTQNPATSADTEAIRKAIVAEGADIVGLGRDPDGAGRRPLETHRHIRYSDGVPAYQPDRDSGRGDHIIIPLGCRRLQRQDAAVEIGDLLRRKREVNPAAWTECIRLLRGDADGDAIDMPAPIPEKSVIRSALEPRSRLYPHVSALEARGLARAGRKGDPKTQLEPAFPFIQTGIKGLEAVPVGLFIFSPSRACGSGPLSLVPVQAGRVPD